MANALIRCHVLETALRFNGDAKDPKLRQEIRKVEEDIRLLEDKRAALVQGGASLEGKEVKKLRNRLINRHKKLAELKPEKDNTIVAALSYPRSGTSQLVSTRPADIPGNNEPVGMGDPDDFLASGLFKEEVQGEAILQVRVADRDRRSRFSIFLRRALSAIFSAVTKDAIGDISEVVLSTTAGELSKDIAKAVTGSSDKERVEQVAASKKVKLRIRGGAGGPTVEVDGGDDDITYENGELTLTLRAPKDLITAEKVTSKNKKSVTTMEKGEENGKIKLRLVAEAL